MISLIIGGKNPQPSEGGVNITLWTRCHGATSTSKNRPDAQLLESATRHVNGRQVDHQSWHVSGEQRQIWDILSCAKIITLRFSHMNFSTSVLPRFSSYMRRDIEFLWWPAKSSLFVSAKYLDHDKVADFIKGNGIRNQLTEKTSGSWHHCTTLSKSILVRAN